ncbi:MAG: hypothetical protein ACFFDW_05645 [Candidatus Thorarchaeota archaeon]
MLMKIVENKILNIIFQVAIVIGLVGIIMFLIQEIVNAIIAGAFAYTVIMIIADFLGIFALIALIVWFFIPIQQTLVLNITYLLGAVYILLFSFSHFFVTLFVGGPVTNFLDDFILSGVSFIGLILLTLVTIGVIVVFSLRFTKREVVPIYEKLAILIWILLIGIYDLTNFFLARQTLTFGKLVLVNLGITFLPGIVEFILLLFAGILLIFNMFTKTDNKILTILTLTLMNIIFFAYAILTVNYAGFDFTTATLVPTILGNHFLMLGTLATIICTFLVFRNKYGAPSKGATKTKTT